MAMNMDALLRIKADVQGENNIRRLGNSLQGLQGQVKKGAVGFNSLKGAVGGFAGVIAGSAIVGGLTAIVKKSIDAGDELFNLQAKTGIAAKALIGLGNAAKLADVDQGTLAKGLTKLSVNLVKAAEGNDNLASAFKRLGVDVKGANGQVVPADKALKQIADRFADMPDGAQKAAAAVALFGKSGADLIPLLNEGAASMEKFTYKVGEDFAARSDLFNDTITELNIKTQGFGLELTDALLPALQSIIEVFSDLFDTKQDWTALFEVIKFGLRTIATVIYATIKLVDQLIKAVVYSFDAIGKALQGDFEAAGRALSQGFGAGLEQAKRDFEQIQKLWTDSPSPGTGRRTGGRSMALDTSAADKDAAAEARRRASEAKRAAAEQERLLERRADLTQKAISLQEQLQRSLEDVNAEIVGVGASEADKIWLKRNDAITENNRLVDDLTESVVELYREIQAAGGQLDIKPFESLINRISEANVALADRNYQQDITDQWTRQGEAIDKATESAWENARALQYNSDIMGGLKDGLNGYIKQIGTMRDAISSLGQQAFQGIEDALVSLVTTGTANFREFAASILKDTARMIIQQMILKTIMQAIGAIGGGGSGFSGAGPVSGASVFGSAQAGFNPLAFSGIKLNAMGNAFAANGIVPFAMGGLVDRPTMFKFANGGAGRLGLMGEAGPEAIMPLRRLPSGRLGVEAAGGNNSAPITVNVSVDANGTSVQGDAGQGEQLGRVISQAVQAELVRQKRPGGLLAA
jgi:lambda family phage tail tape measure protein